jgi:hypothetical protein
MSRAATARRLSLLAALALTLPLAGFEPVTPKSTGDKPDKPQKPASAGDVEVRFTDDSTLKLRLRDEKIEFQTDYGKLLIPVGDIRQIEFATRIPDDLAKKIETAIADLGKDDFKTRDTATAELHAIGPPAFAALEKASKSSDAEVAKRAQEVLDRLREKYPEEQLEVRPFDVVQTDHSKIAGRIQGGSLKVTTKQFGDQPMKLSDVRRLNVPGFAGDADVAGVEQGPENLSALGSFIGKTYRFRVTGNTTGSIYGTDVYTTDSSLATAAVHAGALKAGQTGVVRVTIVAPPAGFVGSTRHGVTSSAWVSYPSAYKVQK